MSARSAHNPPTRVENAIVKTRKFRTPIETELQAYEPIVPAIRPGPGIRGVPFQLKVNWFRVQCVSRTMFIYEVKVERAGIGFEGNTVYRRVEQQNTISTVVYKTVHQYGDAFLNPWRVIFDDFEYMYTPDLLQFDEEMILHTSIGQARYRTTIKRFVKFHFNLSTPVEDIDRQWSSIFIKLLLSQNARFIPPEKKNDHEQSIHARFAHFGGGMYFIPRAVQSAVRKLVQPGVEGWTGTYLSYRQIEDRSPIIEVGKTTAFFMTLNLNLLDLYVAIINFRMGDNLNPIVLNETSVMVPQMVKDITEKLKNVKFKCAYVPGEDRDGFFVDKLERHDLKFVRVLNTHETADNQFLKVPGGKVSVEKWYEDKGEFKLNHPMLPLCEFKKGISKHFLPMEVVFTSDKPQKFTGILDFYAKLRIPKLLTLTPQQHYKLTLNLKSKMEHENDPFMRELGCELDTEMLECTGRVLEKRPIVAKDDSGENIARVRVDPETGEFALKQAYETTDKEIVFIVCKTTDRIDDESLMSFYRGLVKNCKSRGMKISPTEIFKKADADSIPSLFQSGLEFIEKWERNDKNSFVFLFFIGNTSPELYGTIKSPDYIHHGIVTQVIKESTVVKWKSISSIDLPDYKSIFHNIYRKLNAKLGGVNHIVDFEDSSAPEGERLPSHEKTMFIGIDAIHPSKNATAPIRSFTLAAIVASIDKNAAKYADRVMLNLNCNETVQHFEHHFAALLWEYHKERKAFPDRIVIMRDGVSNSEKIKAASREIQSLKAAWIRVANGVPSPPFTYIVVQKSAKTRFFRSDINESNANPFPATTISEGPVSPHEFDFFLIAHHTPEGTSTAPHYTVVYDESGFSTDEIKEMCFSLCCLYTNCSKSIKIPAPIKYADKRCSIAAEQFGSAKRNGVLSEIEDIRSGQSSKSYKEDVAKKAMDIENFLNRNINHPNKYPGMPYV